jgi:hypothetical protein
MIDPKPSRVEDTVQCDRCYRWVHDDCLFEVLGSGNRDYHAVHRLCHRCVSECVEQGEIVTGGDAQFINFR